MERFRELTPGIMTDQGDRCRGRTRLQPWPRPQPRRRTWPARAPRARELAAALWFRFRSLAADRRRGVLDWILQDLGFALLVLLVLVWGRSRDAQPARHCRSRRLRRPRPLGFPAPNAGGARSRQVARVERVVTRARGGEAPARRHACPRETLRRGSRSPS
jgi:hypothetical protein